MLFKSHKSYFSCFMRMPEKVFDCGYVVYNVYIKTFSQKSTSKKYTFILPSYLLYSLNNAISTFHFTPPIAGIHILCIDRGSIHSIILFMFFNYIKRQFQQLRYLLHDHFDYICSTSTDKETFSL